MSGVFYLRNVLQFVIDCFEQGSFFFFFFVGNTYQLVLHIVFIFMHKICINLQKLLDFYKKHSIICNIDE